MKRALKIFGITLGSLLGVTIVLVAIVVGVACHVVFTPKKLTPIVNDIAGQFVGCPYTIDEVNLSLIREFPNAGLCVKGLYVMNPMEGAQSDTLLGVPELVIGINIQQYLDSQQLSIETVTAENVMLNAYINEEGAVNWDVLTLPNDTTEDEDSSATVLPFDINVRELKLSTSQLSFVDKKDSLELTGLSLNLLASATADSTLSSIRAHVNELVLDWQGLNLQVTGDAAMEESITMDLTAITNDWPIHQVLAQLPEQYSRLKPAEVEADGILQASAIIKGQYDEKTMPLVDAKLLLKDGKGHYDLKTLPYKFDGIKADLTAHVDLNDKAQTKAQINELTARTGKTSVRLTGNVTEVLKAGDEIALGNPLCALNMTMQVNLPDADYWIKDDSTYSHLEGTLKGNIALNSRLDDITNLDYSKIKLSGKMDIANLNVIYQDSTKAQAGDLTLSFIAPCAKARAKNTLSADCQLALSGLHAEMPGIEATVGGGTLAANVEMNMKDSESIPTLNLDFDLKDVVADMDSIHAHLAEPKGNVSLTQNRKQKNAPLLHAKIQATAIEANMGADMAAQTGSISIEANARYNKDGENILLQWNPRLNFDLKDGLANLSMVPVPVKIPAIKFEYNNHNCHIDTSRIVLGSSDFELAGHLQNIGHWLSKEADLIGNLRFTSSYTNVDELLDIINNIGGDEEESDEVAAEETTTEPTTSDANVEGDPFMVPKNVSLTLTTNIRKADAFGQHLNNLGGKLYVQDGIAVLEEIGFICEAAKLQLTGIYKTPRKDHIYVGLDYHMLDIDLQQLIAMVPQLDTLVPMLSALRGAAQFHIAAETFVNSRYELKPSTLRGACAIEGKNLVLLDNETFSTIAKLLMFNKKTENLVDSISAQITLYKDMVSVYPFCLSMDNYMVAVGGNHYLDMDFNYHASVLSPIYLGVDVTGNLDDLDIKLAKCRYAKDFKPLFHRDVDEKAAAIRKMISDSLKKNVTIE